TISGEALYKEGVAAYNRGDYAAARPLFQQAQAANYKPGLFKDSPARYLKKIDEREHSAAAVVETPAPSSPAPAAVAEPAPTTVTEPAVAPAPGPGSAELDLQATARLEQAKAQQRAFEAQQLVARAQEAQKDNRLQDAAVLYREAARLDPSNKAAVEGQA